MRGVVEHADVEGLGDVEDPVEAVREERERPAEDHERGPFAVEEAGERVDVDVVGRGVVGELDDAVAADARGAFGVMAEVAAGPPRQGGERRPDRREARVDGEVGERGALHAYVRERSAHGCRDRPGREDLDDLQVLQPRLDLLGRIPEARAHAEMHVVGGRNRPDHGVGAGVEHQAADVHRVDVRPHRPGCPLEVLGRTGLTRGLDLLDAVPGGCGRPRDRDVAHPMPIVMPLRWVKLSRAPSIEYSDPSPLSFLPP